MIGIVTEQNGQVCIFDDKNRSLGSIILGGGKLAGFNSKCVCIEKGSRVLIYDDKKRQTANIPLNGGEFYGCADKIMIKNGKTLTLYDERGRKTGTKFI